MSNNISLQSLAAAHGLTPEDRETVGRLVHVLQAHNARNQRLSRYYNAEVDAKEVNIGIAVPDSLADLDVKCSWPRIAVDALAKRSHLDGFWVSSGDTLTMINDIAKRNNLTAAYGRAITSELVHGVVFATLGYGVNGVTIRYHTAETASALYDGATDSISAGLVIIDSRKYNQDTMYRPNLVYVYTPTYIIALSRDVHDASWHARYMYHQLGHTPMVAMVHAPTTQKPFGSSRISREVISLTNSMLRESLRLEVSSETFTSPQKVILGGDETLQDELAGNYQAYLSSILTISKDSEGDVPTFTQIAAASMAPHLEVIRSLASSFSAATNVPTSELGVVADSNPSSAEAITAAREGIILDAERLNESNAASLRDIMALSIAIEGDTDYADALGLIHDFSPIYRNPAQLSQSAQADAAIKIASGAPGFGGSRAYFRLCGMAEHQIDEVMAEISESQTNSVLNNILNSVVPDGGDDIS